MARPKRDPDRWKAGRGDARKTMWEAGWHADIRIRGRSLLAKWLHACLWDLARTEMRQILAPQWTPKALALEVDQMSTPHQIIEALNELAEAPALVSFLPDGRIDVLGVKSIHRALEAWKDAEDKDISKRVQSYPNETNRKQSSVDVTGRDVTVRDLTGQDVDLTGRDVQSGTAETETTASPHGDSQETNDTPDTAPATEPVSEEPDTRQPTPEQRETAHKTAMQSPHAWIRDASKRAAK